MADLSRIAVEPGKRSGTPCIRGVRITVDDVPGYLDGGMSIEALLSEIPELSAGDADACFAWRESREGNDRTHPIIRWCAPLARCRASGTSHR